MEAGQQVIMGSDPVTHLMEQGIKDQVFPGAVLLCARKQDILYHQAFGVADLQTQRPVTTNALFDLASLTKPLATAIAMMVLVQQKQLDLDVCLKDLLPITIGTPKAEITLDMLLRHTSGLPAHREYFRQTVSHPHPMQAMDRLVLSEPLISLPGVNQVYSDLGYMVLSGVVREVTQTRLDRFVRDHVYQPLGIDDLFFIDLTSSIAPEAQSRLVSTRNCPWRGRVLKGEVEDENAWVSGGIQGHAGLFGTAAAVYRLCLEILQAMERHSPRVLNPKVTARFIQKYPGHSLVAGFDIPAGPGSAAGRYFSPRTVGHLGFTGTSFWIDPDNGRIVILLTNRVHPSRANQKIRKFRPEIHDCIVRHL
ncbi:MAG: serine hydrolase domain-containing protein [Desulfotignum sp.]